jgi:uncharacterized protein YuzE
VSQIEVISHSETGSTYVYLKRGEKSARTEEIEDGFLVDFDRAGEIVGFEILATRSDNLEKQAVMKVISYLTGQIDTHTVALDELREYTTAV